MFVIGFKSREKSGKVMRFFIHFGYYHFSLLHVSFSTALEVTGHEVTAFEVTAFEVTAFEVTGHEVTVQLIFFTQLRHVEPFGCRSGQAKVEPRHVERSRDTRHETHIVNQAPPFYLGCIYNDLNFCIPTTIATYHNPH
jgi:hypothetical protein